MKQETLEEAAEKSSLYNEIYSIVKQIPRKETISDAMDYPSATSSIEELFHKWQQKQDKKLYSEEEVKDIVEQTIEKFYKHFYTLTKAEMKEQWFEQFKKK